MADLTRVSVGCFIECVEGVFEITKINGDNYRYREVMFTDDEYQPCDYGMEGVWTARDLGNNKYQVW